MPKTPIQSLILFGDSDTDGGAGAHGVYERTNHTWATPPYHEGRMCNGPIWPEYLAQQLGIPYDGQLNFAVGGAQTGITNAIDDERFATTGILAQVREYVREHPQIPSDALVVVWGGGNNFAPTMTDPLEQIVHQAMADIIEAIQLLQTAHATTVLLGTLPNLAYLPSWRIEQAERDGREIAPAFNQQLQLICEQLRYVSQTTIQIAEIDQLVHKVMASPQEYGFTNREAPCLVDDVIQSGSDPNQSIFWDAYHYTSAMHKLIAQQFYEALMG